MLGGGSRELLEYQSIVRAFEGLPDRRDARAGARTEREREASVSKRRLADLCASVETVAGHVAANVAAFRVTAGASDRYERMHALLERQPYRLAFWRVAADEINYRRFFDINDLAGLSTERDDVFEATHCLLAEHARAGRIDGFRIDHPDGLYDPAGYFERLRERVSTGEGAAAPFYVLAEKILAPFEHLREEWAVDGTTGYDYANAVSGLGVVPESLGRFNRYYRDFTGEGAAFDDVLLAAKRKIVRVHMSSELGTLANALDRIAQARPETRDFTLNNIREALLGIAAGFPVYRTYVVPGGTAAEDVEYVDWAIAAARRHDPETSPDLYAFIRARLLLEGLEYEDPAYREACARFAMKFQQYTAPVMAKALEDTSFYRYVRLVSLNEVGGDPRRFGTTPSAFHRQNRERARRWPRGMLAGSTHDSKRSEDVRARINVLTERPDAWWERVRRWRRFNRRLRRRVDDARAPSRTDEYLYYQTLAGVGPLESPDEAGLESLRSRLIAYMVKAAREAKLSTSWSHPSSEYEEALAAFVGESLRRTDSPFVEDLDAFTRESARDGLLASLGQVALRLTSPGVPDVYQGGELWDFSLVDPDNRRPVDYGLREQHLTWLEANASPPTPAVLSELLERLDDGRLKLCLVWRLLALRREHPDVFSRGDYLPLTAEGALEEHVVAYARAAGTTSVIVVVGRWFARLGERRGSRCVTGNAWDDTRVRAVDGVELAADWRDWLSGREVPPEEGGWRLERLFADLPIAVLVARH
jgi:(1->4)-alpha-D-glucan 1-alpha-D-glucosylmutase